MYSKIVFTFILFSNIIFAQNLGSGVTDADGNVYETLIYGTQEVMKENLKTTKYCNGDTVENVSDYTLWSNLTTGAWSYYDNDFSNNSIYGKLYNFYAVSDSRNICPCNWHVPTEAEWNILLNYLGGPGVSQNVGGKMKETGFTHWQNPNYGATNESNFNGLPAGIRLLISDFYGKGQYLNLWTSTIYDSNNSYKRDLAYNANVFSGSTTISKKTGTSIRCMKDEALKNLEYKFEKIKIFPNPTLTIFNVSIEDISEPLNYSLHNLLGNFIDKGIFTTNENTVDISKLNQGIYFLTISSKNSSQCFKIVKN